MKIAEALMERASIDKQLHDLNNRLMASARYVEGEEPTEYVTELLERARALISRQYELIAKINMTNARTVLEDGMTVTQAIAERAGLAHMRKFLAETADHASPGRDPYSRGRRRTELPEKTDIPVIDMRREADIFAAAHRVLDAKIQVANWNTELDES